ncbi:hypothetical protein [Tenacibaculum geojense]|uniref:Uncharacterized protein n=1 Tax=Tenacibaculum geojense TaxID=915352 RepID=A0ABW3JPG5_9FLAO
MEDFYDKVIKYKKEKELTYSDLGKIINVTGDTFRMAVSRKTLSDQRKEKILNHIKSEQNEQNRNRSGLFLFKDGVKVSLEEMISFITINIKEIKKSGELEFLIEAINTVENIDRYNTLSSEIEKIKSLLERNKEFLK